MKPELQPLLSFLRKNGIKFAIKGNVVYFILDTTMIRVWAADAEDVDTGEEFTEFLLWEGGKFKFKSNKITEIIDYIKRNYKEYLPPPGKRTKDPRSAKYRSGNMILLSNWYPIKLILTVDKLVEKGYFKSRAEGLREFLRLGMIEYLRRLKEIGEHVEVPEE
ncbi:hypothetical protein J7K74_03800 [Candidatus Woesearchaeota archaeon]|nr:hypothetical protein [Candidatus Woesearchaeota archaeon]